MWKLVMYDLTGFALTINTGFEIIFLMRFLAKPSL